MSKIGVGIGDEFPVDDGAPKDAAANPQEPRSQEEQDRAEFEAWKRRRDAYRAQREAWRAARAEWKQRRREWRDRWRAERRAWQEECRNGPFAEGRPADYRVGPYAFWHGPGRAVVVVAIVALAIVALTHIGLVLAGIGALALLFMAYHHFGHDPLDLGPQDYSRTPPPAADKPTA